MNREEAISILERKTTIPGDGYTWEQIEEAINLAISSLRGPTREQVEKMFTGCDFCGKELDDYPYIVAHGDYSSSDACYEPSFCPLCGKPLTEKAVDTVMERLEALNDGESD